MPNIKPISDLRNDNNVLNDGTVGAPVFSDQERTR